MVAGPVVSLRQPYNGGTEPFIVELSNYFVEHGHSVDVIAKDAEERDKFQLIEFSESPMSMKDDIHPEWRGQEYYRMFQYGLMNVEKYDVIHYNSFMPEIYAMGSFFSKPSVLTLHLPLSEKFKTTYGLFMKQAHPTCVAVSDRLQKEWQPYIGGSVEVINNGVNLEKWPLVVQAKREYLLWSGRITSEKNPLDAIRIAKKMRKPLKIVGKIFDQAYFNQNIKSELNDSITYEGHVERNELQKLISGAAVFLATALWQEPFGLTILEMLASGIPVVGYSSAIPPVLRHATVSRAVETTDWCKLLPEIQTAMSVDPAICREFAANFSLEAMAQKYMEVYAHVAKR